MVLIKSITICPKNITITKGKWYYGAYAKICPTNATCKCLTWYSSNSNIASVNEHGHICGVSEGMAVIYATTQDGSGAVDFCHVTVIAPVMVGSVTVTPTNKVANVGDTFILSATVCPSNADDKRIRWTSCDNNIAEVDYLSGQVTTKTAGTVNIYANTVDGSAITGYCSVTVQNVPVESITINPITKTTVIDAIFSLTATVSPSNATDKRVLWNSSDSTIATVDSTGTVTAKNPGTVTIQARAKDRVGVSASCTITINDLSDINSDSWEEMGFMYGIHDSFNVNHDLPPISYQNWIARGRQKAIYISDKSILPIVGHAMLLIRSDEGLWYKTQFAGPWLAPAQAKIYCETISEPEKNILLDKNGVDYVYLYGDYSNSLIHAQDYAKDNNKYNGKYNPLTNNCLHYVNEILSYGNNINDSIDQFIANNSLDVPQTYYNDLKNLLES